MRQIERKSVFVKTPPWPGNDLKIMFAGWPNYLFPGLPENVFNGEHNRAVLV